ncbi:MAG TPA: hypothetical protein DGR97_09510 [Gammaproteobacteria bacterium]|nr:hypothetical protein [Gammaproteobacteria bacterium]|tara:strand:- start:799 stop:1080 length:282 start_codon:yes stop_codon:yes gene_type:complete
MAIEFLDPTHENVFGKFTRAPRLDTLEGAIIAIISNGKKGTIPFFDAYEHVMRKTYRVAEVVRVTKSNISTPVDTKLLGDAERWNVLIAGVGD